MEITTKTIEQYQGYTLTLHTSANGRKMWELKDNNDDYTAPTLTLNHKYDFENETTTATVEVYIRTAGQMGQDEAADYAEVIMNASKAARYLNEVIKMTEATN